MRTELDAQIARLSRRMLQLRLQCDQLQGQPLIQARQSCQQVEEELDGLWDRQDEYLRSALRAILTGRRSYDAVMTFLAGKPCCSRTGEFVYIRPENQLVYVRKCLRQQLRLLEERCASDRTDQEAARQEMVRLLRESDHMRNRILASLKASDRSYAEVLAYVRRRR